jgi:hypothetical protein
VKLVTAEASKSGDASQNVRKIRVRVDSGNRAWDEGLMRMLANHAGLEMLGGDVNEIFRVEKILEDFPDVLLLTSRGNLDAISRTSAKRGWLRRACVSRCSVAQARSGSFCSTCALEFAVTCCWDLRLLMYGKRWKRCMPEKHLVRARFAGCCSIILSAKRRVCLPERCGSNWVDAAGATTGSTDRTGANEQGNCEPFLFVGTNGEESFIPYEA